MIAAWMLETTVVALLFVAGAAIAQRVFALYRGVPVRWIWAGAIAAVIAISALWLAPHAATPVGVVATSGSSVGTVAPVNQTAEFRLPAVSAATERGLIAVWIAASSALSVVLLFAFIRLGREGRGWEYGEVGGAAVRISDSLGPAAVGMLRPRVVLPRWVLTLDEVAQRAIVAHEREHQLRRDPALLMAGLTALVLMPWNVGVWVAWRGLRLAVEFDCDERVLRRGLDRAGYAQILLGAWGQTRASWLASAALTRGSGLGSRVQHLMRPEPRRRRMKALFGAAAVAVLVFAACDAPSPRTIAGPLADGASRNVMVADGQTDPLVIIDGVKQNGDTSGFHVMSDEAAATAGKAGLVVRESSHTGVTDRMKGILSRVPADSIKSIEILKGNMATAMYGPQALHGVIIITTKSGAAAIHQ